MSDVVLELKNISKFFANTIANDNISLAFRRGEVHCILGENGAGKTTLMNIIEGLYHPDTGSLHINGELKKISSPRKALRLGIGMVHQHFSLADKHSAYENIIVGYLGLPFFIRKSELINKIKLLSEQYGLSVDLYSKVNRLSISNKQKVEIIKTLINNPKIIIFDEPTSVLSKGETVKFFSMLKTMKSNGYTIIFISHKLNEIMTIADRISVLSKGRLIGTYTRREATKEFLANKMLGGKTLSPAKKKQSNFDRNILLLKDASVKNGNKRQVTNFNLTLKQREIFGVAGVSGGGQLELANALFGILPMSYATYKIDGLDITDPSPKKMMSMGVRLIPADRHLTGIAPEMNASENMIINRYDHTEFSNKVFLKLKQIIYHTLFLIQKYKIVISKVSSPVKNLSGGNVQKIIVAREVNNNFKILIAVFPTRGLDIGATEQIHKLLLEEQQKGLTILIISEDLDELTTLSDRIGVMYDGELIKIQERGGFDINEIGLAMGGHK